MSNEDTVRQYNVMTMQPERKNIRDLRPDLMRDRKRKTAFFDLDFSIRKKYIAFFFLIGKSRSKNAVFRFRSTFSISHTIGLTGGKTLVSEAAKKKQRVPAFERIDDKHTRQVLRDELKKKAVFPVESNIQFFTTLSCAEPIKSEHNEWLKPDSVRVKKVNVAVPSKLPRNKKSCVQDGLLG